MVADQARVDAYAGALRAAVRPGDRVLDVGAGFGFFSVIAARAGAAHVDAVEPNPAIHLGPRVASANGCDGRISFHRCRIAELTVAPVDVLVLDLRGPTPFGQRSLETLIDTRDRLLRRGGRIIAQSDTIMVAPARTPDVFRREVQAAHRQLGVDLQPVERIVYDTPLRCAVAAADLLAEGVRWVTIEYATVDRTSATGVVSWTFDGAADIAGLAMWFETDLGGGCGFSTKPGGEISAYRQMFIPFRQPIHVEKGTFRVEVSVHQAGDNNVWAWRGWHVASGGNEELVVDQNSLAEIVLDPGAFPEAAGGQPEPPREEC
jgi:predicted RNA methylase